MEETALPQKINAEGIIDAYRGMHYRFHQRIDPAIWPQVHDFYELTLLTSGTMYLRVNGAELALHPGTLVLLRPGDVHSRRSPGECTYINLAFPAQLMADMFRYLNDPESYSRILREFCPVVVPLSEPVFAQLRSRLEKLNLLPVDRPHLVCAQLRWVMVDIVLEHILPSLPLAEVPASPQWLEKLLKHLESPENFGDDLQTLAALSGCTKEHICRSFRKHLGTSPTAYINSRRLNYAANLLLHSDAQVIDIAYTCGFQSLSRFYHAFKKEFGISPLEYRKGLRG